MGKMSVDLIILNAFIPVIFQYGNFHRRNDIKDKCIRILEELTPEKNDLLSTWIKNGIKPVNAFESQALIHLSTRYCCKQRCLECMVGNHIMKRKSG